MSHAEDLEDSWKALRPSHLRPKWTPPSKESVQEWVLSLGEGGSCVLSVEGPTSAHRELVYSYIKTLPVVTVPSEDWREGFINQIVTRPPVWRVLQDLIRVEEFVIYEPLKSIVDQGGHLARLFHAIWEIRFLFEEEGVPPDPFARYLTDWVVAPKKPGPILQRIHLDRALPRNKRLDAFFFLLVLSRQNGCFNRAVFVIDGLEAFADRSKAQFRELQQLVKTAKKWEKKGSSVGFCLGSKAVYDLT